MLNIKMKAVSQLVAGLLCLSPVSCGQKVEESTPPAVADERNTTEEENTLGQQPDDTVEPVAEKNNFQHLRHALAETPREHSVTMNCHGNWSSSFFEVPDGVFVLIFDPKGVEQNYTLANPSYSFEKIMFASNSHELMLPTFTSRGWRLYQPGEKMRSIRLNPWQSNEFAHWAAQKSNQDELAKIKELHGDQIPDFHQLRTKYESLKVKVFAPTSLRKVVYHLATKHNRENPVLLMPFTCNAKGHHDKAIASLGKHSFEPLLPRLDALYAESEGGAAE